jgi:hypothetical protein
MNSLREILRHDCPRLACTRDEFTGAEIPEAPVGAAREPPTQASRLCSTWNKPQRNVFLSMVRLGAAREPPLRVLGESLDQRIHFGIR